MKTETTIGTPASRIGQNLGFKTFIGGLTLGALLSSAPKAGAVAVRIISMDAEASARGDAFAATADNPSAIYYNPAGITQLDGLQAELNTLEYFGTKMYYQSPTGHQVESKFHLIPVPSSYFTYTPKDSQFSFGVGVFAPFGLAEEYYDNSGFRSIAISSKLQYITLNPVAAWKILPELSLAAGPEVNYSKLDIKRGLLSPSDVFQFTGSGISFGGNAALMWQPCKYVSFGATYRSPSTMHYTGTTYYTSGGVTGASGTAANFEFPQVISGGISYRPNEKWNIEADIDWTDWHTLRTATLNGMPPNLSGIVGNTLPFALNWQSSYLYEFGVTRYLEHGWWVAAGYIYSTETTSAQNYTPAVPDTTLHVGSLGVGRKLEHWSWALSGQIITGPSRSIGNSPTSLTGESANGSYRYFIPTVSASVGYKF